MVGMVVVDEEEFCRLPGMIALLRAAQALARGDMPEAVKNAQWVLDLAPEDAHLMLGGAASVLGLAAWARGDLEVAHRMTADGMANVRRAGYISSAIGALVRSPADGIVVKAEWANGYGNVIFVSHGYGYSTRYGHLSSFAVRAGQRVKRGDVIGHVGSTGRSTGPHLHYEVRVNNNPVNPLEYILNAY